MREPDDAFSKLLGRQPTEEERRQLYQVRDALGLENNDALWLVLVALNHYDSLFRQYPEKMAAAAVAVLDGQRAVLAQTAAAETAKARRSLAQAVVTTAQDLAGRAADAARWRAWAAVAAGSVLFGALCITCGFVLGAGSRPPWWHLGGGSAPQRLVAAVLGAPAGWTVFAMLVPLAGHYAWTGWNLIRSGEGAPGERLTGLGMLAGSLTGLLASVLVLGRVLGG